MRPKTSSFLRSKFKEYYLEASLEVPPGFEAREWGFLFFDGSGMRRHKSFSRRGELVDYVRSMVPAHIYHSAAYYETPAAPTMKEKIWKGADLIFDLDADHLRGAPRSYADMLEMVKQETKKLLDFLTTDFGFFEEEVRVVFSGGRGYHIHVRDPRVLPLQSDSRREIVDYLTGRGLDEKRLPTKIKVTGDAGVESAWVLRCPPEKAPGWGGRFNRAIVQFAEDIRGLDPEDAVKKLKKIRKVGAASAAEFYGYLKEDQTLKDIRAGNLDSFKGIQGIWKYIIENYLRDQFVQMAGGETDEPVTADVKRLIRFPMSLHGGSGFRVTPLTVEGLDSFEPLRDAVVFGDDPVRVTLSRPFKLDMGETVYDLDQGSAELPTWAAVFLMGRGVAELGKG